MGVVRGLPDEGLSPAVEGEAAGRAAALYQRCVEAYQQVGGWVGGGGRKERSRGRRWCCCCVCVCGRGGGVFSTRGREDEARHVEGKGGECCQWLCCDEWRCLVPLLLWVLCNHGGRKPVPMPPLYCCSTGH